MHKYHALGALEQYLQEVRQAPAIDRALEALLLEQVKAAVIERDTMTPDEEVLRRGMEARNELVERLQPLVISVARSLRPLFQSMELLDLIQECNVVLLSELEVCFKRQTDAPVAAFFATHLRFALFHVLWSRDSLVRLPAQVHTVLRRRRRVEQELWLRDGSFPSFEEVATELGMAAEDLAVEVAFAQALQHVESLDTMLFEDGDQVEPEMVSVFGDGAAAPAASSSHPEVQTIMKRVLSPVEYEVLALRYGMGEGQGAVRSQTKVGELLGRRQSVVDKMEKRAQARLRSALLPVASAGRTYYELRTACQEDYYTSQQAAQLLGMGRRALYDCVYAQVVPYEEQRPRGGQARYRFPKREIDALVAAGGLTAEQRSSARRVSLDLSRARSGTTPETAAARARRIERDAVMLPSIVA